MVVMVVVGRPQRGTVSYTCCLDHPPAALRGGLEDGVTVTIVLIDPLYYHRCHFYLIGEDNEGSDDDGDGGETHLVIPFTLQTLFNWVCLEVVTESSQRRLCYCPGRGIEMQGCHDSLTWP